LWQRTLPENINVSIERVTIDSLVNADPVRIQQAFMNLVVNARDAMPDGGTLMIRIEQIEILTENDSMPGVEPGRWIQITVTDTGVGIPQEIFPRLFEPFYSTKGARGTGLGLAQVYGIVKQHDGHINVTSQVNKGTTFTVLLPRFTLPQTIPMKESPDTVIEGNGETVLLVEDEEALRDALSHSLIMINYKVITAENGRDALRAYGENVAEIDLVLCDMVMPHMGGMKLLQQFRAGGITIPFVMMTGHPLKGEMSDLRTLGLADWILKPVTLKSLSHLLSSALQEEPG
ncbi:MAG: ATP-binding protein, partial [Candidatus Promineifilaceae bacterium]